MQTFLTAIISATILSAAPSAYAQQKKDTVPAPSVKQLKTHEVTSTTPPVTMQGGTMIVNVGKSVTAAGSNAWDVVTKSPGVITDNNNNLQLNGKPVTVYLDGRPARLSGEDLKTLLASTAGSNIDKIELMSMPSGKYDAQDGAIINIKMFKPKDLGTNGNVTLTGGFGRYLRTTEGITLNHRSKGVNLYGGYDHNYAKTFTHNTNDRLYTDGYVLTESDYNRENKNTHNVRAGVDFDLSKTSSAGVLVKSMFNKRTRLGDNYTTLPDSIFRQGATGTQRLVNPSVNAYFRTASAKNKNELTINADYFNHRKDWDDQFSGQYHAYVTEAPIGNSTHIRNFTESAIDLYSLSADYTQQFKAFKLEAGLKSTFTETDNNMHWETMQNGKWENDPSKTNHFIYKENVNAAYAGATKTIKKWTFSAMLRMEHTNAKGNSLTMDQKFSRDYVQLFPSASASYAMSPMNQFSFSYRRSINRFGFDIVNPFTTYVNAYSLRQGNPNIQPMLSQAVQATWSHKYQLFTTVAFTRMTDNLSMTFRQDPVTKVQIMSFDNQTNFNLAYANVVWVKPFTPKIRSTFTVTGLYLGINTKLDGIDYKKNSVTAFANIQNSFTLPKGFTAEVNGNLRGPIMAGYAVLKTQGNVDLGLSKTIMKGNGSLKLAAVDIFNTNQMRYKVQYSSINNLGKMNMDTRAVNLTFSYKFGNSNVKAAKARKNSIETESGRTSSQQGF
ncbi:outer membrane beta-barrel family protein [Chitinophaga rhizosphaerae]|uniref:outer membrane beta-barrel family protein n=1 Tax=Chitinophaga rhizosphaerae TaxID=1864947 RepID=UPI000F8067BB|nr:outer membrane beta-barrel family protein [Chitinophaga rhizosphaerae]